MKAGDLVYVTGINTLCGFSPTMHSRGEEDEKVLVYPTIEAAGRDCADDAMIWLEQVKAGDRDWEDALSLISELGIYEGTLFDKDGKLWVAFEDGEEFGPVEVEEEAVPATKTGEESTITLHG